MKNETVAQESQDQDGMTASNRRRWLVILPAALLLAGALAVTTLVVLDSTSSADLRITRGLQDSATPSAIGAMRAFSLFGSTKVMIPLSVVVFVLLLARKERRGAAYFAAASILMVAVTQLMKALINRPRPAEPVVAVFDHPGDASFPSGHVTAAVIFAGFLAALVILSPQKSRAVKVGAGASASVAVGLVGLSRIYLGAHWLSDVLGGFLIGGAALVVVVAHYTKGRIRGDSARGH